MRSMVPVRAKRTARMGPRGEAGVHQCPDWAPPVRAGTIYGAGEANRRAATRKAKRRDAGARDAGNTARRPPHKHGTHLAG